jgi:hypothetical protein
MQHTMLHYCSVARLITSGSCSTACCFLQYPRLLRRYWHVQLINQIVTILGIALTVMLALAHPTYVVLTA